MLDVALERQATDHPHRPPEYRGCPHCHEPLVCDDLEARSVLTRAGEAAWVEPQAYCRFCRQAFFPSYTFPVMLCHFAAFLDLGRPLLRVSHLRGAPWK